MFFLKWLPLLLMFQSTTFAKEKVCEEFEYKEKLILKTKKILNGLKQAEAKLSNILWTGKIPDGCYCYDLIGTDNKFLDEKKYKCLVGAGVGLEITYSNDLSIRLIQYFEP